MTYFPPPHPAPWKRATPGETGLDPNAVAAAARHASEHETPWSRDLARMVGERLRGAAAVERDARAGASARRAEWSPAAQRARRRRMGRYDARRHDLQRRQELSLDPRRSRLGSRSDRRSARKGPPHGRRRRFRSAAQRRDHLAPPLAADLGMGRGAVGQAGPDRPQPSRRRPAEHGAKGQPPRSPGAGRILGIQRRPGQPAEPRPAAALAPATPRGVPRTGHGSDRRFAGVGMARLPQFLCRDRRQAGAVGRRVAGIGAAGFSSVPATRRGSG